jgi:site-specific DNA-cytosine methylase
MKYKTLDLFSGIRKGFELTGFFKNTLSAEIDKYTYLTYKHLFNENPCNDVSSEKFKLNLLIQLEGLSFLNKFKTIEIQDDSILEVVALL